MEQESRLSGREWLDGLKVGDRVASYGFRNVCVAKVERITPTQIVTNSGKYRKADGEGVGYGDAYDRPRIGPLTQEIIDKIRHSRFATRLQYEVTWSVVPLPVLEQVVAILDSQKAEKSE